jgi:CheY-like chemotaxis protein
VARIVLVADDSPTIQKRAIGILKGQGFEVETVSNGVAAIKRLAVLHPVLVLADVSMPGRDGYEVCDFIKKSSELSQVPVLLVASDMEPYDSARGAQVRADGIITKPFEPPELISMVVKFAERFEAATAPIAVPSSDLSEPLERTHEFAPRGEELDNAPTVVQHIEPDFSAAAGGIAFDQHSSEESLLPEPVAGEISAPSGALPWEVERTSEPALQTQNLPAGESLWAVETASAQRPIESASSSPDQGPFFVGGPEPVAAEPVFLEEQPVQHSEHSHPDQSTEPGEMAFRTPAELPEPVWRDDTPPAEPAPESVGPTVVAPQPAAEVPLQSPEMAVEQQTEQELVASPVEASSLDGFSLDDAATGQVHFPSAPTEVAHQEASYAAPAETAPVSEFAQPELLPETVQPETAPSEVAPETVYAEATPPQALPETGYTETAPAETAPESVLSETALVASESPLSQNEVTPIETMPPVSDAETAPAPLSETIEAPSLTPAVVPEPAPLEPEPAAAASEPVAAPTMDWELFCAIVRKAVVKMSPAILPEEVVNDLARRLADEIATEITTGSTRPARS